MSMAYSKKHGVLSIRKEPVKYRDQDGKEVETEFTVKLSTDASLFFCELPEYVAKFNTYITRDEKSYKQAFSSWGHAPPRSELQNFIFEPTYKEVVKKAKKVCKKTWLISATQTDVLLIEYSPESDSVSRNEKNVAGLTFKWEKGKRVVYSDGQSEIWTKESRAYDKESDGWRKTPEHYYRRRKGTYDTQERTSIIIWTAEREAVLKQITEGIRAMAKKADAFFNKSQIDDLTKAIDKGAGKLYLTEGADNVKTESKKTQG